MRKEKVKGERSVKEKTFKGDRWKCEMEKLTTVKMMMGRHTPK